jgi:Zn-dependent M28 family amino/carboxypeptidase
VLEIARRLGAIGTAGAAPAWKVRLAFWTGEELGLWGAFNWFGERGQDDLAAIDAYLNFDMLGSPNGVREIYDWSANGVPSSAPLEALFGRAFDLEDLSWELVQVGSSDDLPFAEAGIPTSGLFSGHNTLKSSEQAELFGGDAGMPLDPCYHLACDTLDNIDPVVLGQMARAAAWVTGYLASGQATLP